MQCLSVRLFVYASIRVSLLVYKCLAVYLSAYLPIYMSIYLSDCVCVCLPICLFVNLSIRTSVHPFTSSPFIYPSVYIIRRVNFIYTLHNKCTSRWVKTGCMILGLYVWDEKIYWYTFKGCMIWKVISKYSLYQSWNCWK